MIFKYYSRSIKTRLIINVIIIHALLMGFVVYDMVEREHDFMHKQLSEKGHDITSILASNAGQYLLNNDIVALNELITGIEKIHDYYMVFILDKEGKVYASLPKKYFNLTLDDTISRQLIEQLKRTSSSSVQLVHSNLLDTLYSIDIDGRHIGYVRTILNSDNLHKQISLITAKGILFILLAIIIGTLFVWLSVRKMTQRLEQLTQGAHQIAIHNFDVKLPKNQRSDEVDTMIEAFEVMQESIHQYITKIDASEKRLNLALEGSSDGLWDWNLLTNEIYYSPRWKEMLGFGDDELENSYETWERLTHLDDIEDALEYIEQFLSSTEIYYEHRMRMSTKSKEYIPILSRGQKIFNSQGRAVRLIGTHVDMSEITKAQERLQHQAEHDTLTNLPNRLLFIERLEKAIIKAQKSSKKIAILFLDLDHFKEINDSLGHNIGDKLLQDIASILEKSMRHCDTISRFGGDEFAIIIDNIEDESTITTLLERIMENINRAHTIEGNEFFTTFSIGIAIYPKDGKDSEMLLKNADAAMYKAKKSGRNSYRFYTNDMTQKALERMQLETALRNALANNGLSVYYQPQVNLQTKKIIGMEALVRWEDEVLGKVDTQLFISLAEEIGLITAIDTFVMKQVVEDVARWNQEQIKSVRVALNISVIELTHGNYFELFSQMLQKSGCLPSQFEFEITESQIMRDPNSSIKKLRELSDMGVELSIDDFGTGYSSLAYLKQLPIHKLKIDKSFIDDIVWDRDDREIIKTIIAMAKNLNLGVIAEGVESLEQVEYLLKNSCDEVQGYYYYRPMPRDEITKILQKAL